MTPLDPVRSHVWDGGDLPDWLQLDDYHFDNNQLVVRTPDGDTRPQPGWLIVGWSDGAVTVCSPTLARRVYGPHGLAGRLTALQAVARGYCPECGRGDAGPTAEDWEQQRRRADEAEAQLRLVDAMRQQNLDAAAAAIQRAETADEAARRALEQRQAMAAERYAWQERGVWAEAALARVQAAVQIADSEDVTDWQRGYRACAERVLDALAEPGPAATQATEPGGLRQPIAAAVDRAFDAWQQGLGETRPQDAVTDTVLAAVTEHLDVGEEQAWCKYCRRAWDSPAHRCESDGEQRVQQIANLRDRWLMAGPPPLGTSINRWWDKRLVELNALLNGERPGPA